MLSITPTVRRRPRGRRRDYRVAILNAARTLCLAQGPTAISARKIAARVGCSATTLYLYYRNVDDLLHHLRMEGHALLADAFASLGPAASALERIRQMGRAYHRFGLAHRGYYELMFGARSAPVRRDAVQREMYTLLVLRDAVQSGIDAGEIRRDVDALVVTNALWAQIHGVTALAVSGMLMQTAADHDRDVLEAVLESAVQWLRTPGANHDRCG